MREKLKKFGPEYLKDADLTALILRTGTKGRCLKDIAEKAIHILDTSRPEKILDELENLNGVGLGKAASIAAACELGRRYCGYTRKKVAVAEDVFPYLCHYADRKQEHFICVSFSGAHEIIAVRTVSVGILNRTLVHPREVFADPIADRAAAIIVCHNHPSGNLTPSEEDLQITWRLSEAGDILGIQLLDHLIIGPDGKFLSFMEECIPLKKHDERPHDERPAR